MPKATWQDVLSDTGSDSDSSSSVKRILTTKSGESKMTIHVDTAVRDRVEAVIGKGVNLSVVENSYAIWGSHHIIKRLAEATTGQYIFMKADYTGWVFTNVDPLELKSKLKEICVEAAPNWTFKIKCKKCTRIKLTEPVLTRLKRSSGEDSSGDDFDIKTEHKAAGKKSARASGSSDNGTTFIDDEADEESVTTSALTPARGKRAVKKKRRLVEEEDDDEA